METKLKFWCGLAALATAGPLSLVAEAQVPREVRLGMRGVYEGNIRGVYFEFNGTDTSQNVISGTFQLKHQWRRSQRVSSDTGRTHRLNFERPTAKGQRVRVDGQYRGVFDNPFTGMSEQVTGFRKVTIRDRGVGKRNRFILRLNEELREGTISLRRARGVLRK